MKIVVCVKVIKGEINPFDAAALECALLLSDDVTVVSMGPLTSKEALLPLTRLGAKVILLSDNNYAGSDTLSTSYILKTAISKLPYDLIIAGRQSIDGDTAQVGPCLSKMLDIPLITNVMEIKEVNEKISCVTRMGDEEKTLPCLITVERIKELRFPSIRSKLGEVLIWDNKTVGADEKRCGFSGSPTKVVKVFNREEKIRHCKFTEKNELSSLIEKLRREDVKKEEIKESDKKLKKIYTVGEEVLSKAKALSEEVIVIKKGTPEEIAKCIKDEKAEVVLWNADLWGRMIAPQVAAMLDTGLCADCTNLETDGEEFFMYRPAMSGDVTAKIICSTLPKMATVRTDAKTSDVVISLGKGAKDSVERLYALADKIGADKGASRGLVDTNKVPYSYQVGLTGRKVSPKVYLAIGISGAPYHICGMEGADYVIAVNEDKDAKIFDYADYGIIASAEEIDF